MISAAGSVSSAIPTTSGLADEMKQLTAALHILAERSGVIANILNKSVNFYSYVLYIRNLVSIYQAIESPSQSYSCNTPNLYVKPFLDERLERSKPIIKDLDNLVGRNSWMKLPLLPATVECTHHINQIKRSDSVALLAHIYVRYLGDLNGGQVLQRLLKDTLNLQDECLNFYKFPEIEDLKLFRINYRNALNNVDVSTETRKTITSAAIAAFQFNIDLSIQINEYEARQLS